MTGQNCTPEASPTNLREELPLPKCRQSEGDRIPPPGFRLNGAKGARVGPIGLSSKASSKPSLKHCFIDRLDLAISKTLKVNDDESSRLFDDSRLDDLVNASS